MIHMLTGLACLTIALLALAIAVVDWAWDVHERQHPDDEHVAARLRVDAVLTAGVTARQWEEFVAHHPLGRRGRRRVHRIGDMP